MRPQRLGHRIDSLPPFAALYRGAFRSGSTRPAWIRSLSRLGYYAWDTAGLPAGRLRFTMDVRGTPRSIEVDAGNRQFNVLYFDKYKQGYEPDVTALVTRLLPDDGVFYDIGSNWGYFPLLIASDAGFTGHCHAFEPFPSTSADLEAVVTQADLTEWITVHRVAVGDSAGTVRMTSGRHSGLARVTADGQGTDVPQQTVDDLDLPPPDVMKVDAEGMEPRIFAGARQTLATHKPFIVFENAMNHDGSGADDTLRMLDAADYRLFVPFNAPGVSGDPFRLLPMPIVARTVFAPYLNLVAVHADRIRELGGMLVTNP